MKKLFYLLTLSFIFSSCDTRTTFEIKKENKLYYGRNVETIIYDSCEYIRFPKGTSTWGSHKGNCKFCKERNK